VSTNPIIDPDEFGEPVSEKYQRLGAKNITDTGMYVRFEPGFGLNVHIGIRYVKDGWPKTYVDYEKMVLSIEGWETLCSLVDEWRER